MKTSSKLSIISSVAALAIVGTGFAAWQFSDSASSAADGNVAITDKTEAGTLTVNPASFVLTLDQNFLKWQSAANDADDTSDITTVELTYKGSENNNVKEEIDFSCDIDNGLAAYVTIGDGSFANDVMEYVGTEIVNTYTLPEISWVDGQKPETQKEYDDMKTALDGKKVTFTFEAAVKE